MTDAQPDLLTWTPKFHGTTFSHARDYDRLKGQALRVFEAMKSGDWFTLSQLHAITGDPEASISARIRGFKECPGVDHEREYVSRGLHRYRLLLNAKQEGFL